jgi:CheY-like chemotaxis protein
MGNPMSHGLDVLPPAAAGADPTVLVVEDEFLIRMSLTDFLEECGFIVLGTANAVDAVNLIETCTTKIDLTNTQREGD